MERLGMCTPERCPPPAMLTFMPTSYGEKARRGWVNMVRVRCPAPCRGDPAPRDGEMESGDDGL